MRGSNARRRPALRAAAADLDTELGRIAAMTIDELRDLWRQGRGEFPPGALSKDLIARALAYWLQEERLGGLDLHVRKVLAALARKDMQQVRHLKIGSVIVREYQDRVYEVLVVPEGFCFQGQVHSSLSTIARKITGTSWNGPRFFGLRSKRERQTEDDPKPGGAPAGQEDKERLKVCRTSAKRSGRRSSVRPGPLTPERAP